MPFDVCLEQFSVDFGMSIDENEQVTESGYSLIHKFTRILLRYRLSRKKRTVVTGLRPYCFLLMLWPERRKEQYISEIGRHILHCHIADGLTS
jgi:hypothetical protein